MIKKLVLVYSALCAGSAVGMVKGPLEDKKNSADGMTIITKWEDVRPFAGDLVVVQATGGILAPNKNDYTIGKANELKVGYITSVVYKFKTGEEQIDEEGHSLESMYVEGAVHEYFGLVNSVIQKHDGKAILVRRPTYAEGQNILAALQRGSFSCTGYGAKIKHILSRQKS